MSTHFLFDLGANVSDMAGGSVGKVTGRATFIQLSGHYYQVDGVGDGSGWTPESHLQLTGIRAEAQEPRHAER